MAEEAPEKSIVENIFDWLAHQMQSFIDGAAHGAHDEHAEKNFFQRWFTPAGWVELANHYNISRGTLLITNFIGIFIAGVVLEPDFPILVLGWIIITLPITLPIGMVIGAWHTWKWYIKSYFIFARTRPILLEVKMPTEVTKSPRAMEVVLTALWFRLSTTTPIDRNWQGGSMPYYSFELVSLGGQVHFYVWLQRDYLRNAFETSMYSQYPEVEIVEVADYALDFHYDEHKHKAFVGDQVLESHELNKHDKRVNAYPIKTYIDFELDTDPKEEFKIDPMSQVLEVLSAVQPDEQAWVQIVIKAHPGGEWKKLVEAEVKKLRKKASLQPGKEEAPDDDERKYGAFPRPTWSEQELMKSMERNLSKLPFDFGCRMVFIGPRNNFRTVQAMAVRWIWRPYGNPNYQIHLRPRNAHNDFDWPWQDYKNHRYEHETHRYLDAYRRRQMWNPPWEDVHNTTSVEVLATMWHPPSRTVKAPGLLRIPSSKSEPPFNLPM